MKTLRTPRPGSTLAVLFLAAAPVPSPSAQERPFTEKVEVNVRTVLVVVTDRQGHPAAPEVSDIEVHEDGVPMRVLGIEPARSARPPEPAPAVGGAPAPPAGRAAALPGIRQCLYIDTALLRIDSVRRVADGVSTSLPAILASGPLEIVLADPQPKTLLPPTRDAVATHAALSRLARDVPGKQRIFSIRRETLRTLREGGPPVTAQMGARQELQLLKDALGRLETWAARGAAGHPGILYLANDGFDIDVTEVYRQEMSDPRFGPSGARGARRGSTPSGVPDGGRSQLLLAFGGEGQKLVSESSAALGGYGWTTISIALGGTAAEFIDSAANLGKVSSSSIAAPPRSSPTFLFARPIEPLRLIADATGGDVVVNEKRLPAVLDLYAGAYLISFRSSGASDGKTHAIEVVSRRPDLLVRAPRLLGGSTPASLAEARAVRALSGEAETSGRLLVSLLLDGVSRRGKKVSGTLHVRADLGDLVSALDRLGGARMRVTIAVEVEGAREPFVAHDEMDANRDDSGGTWYYDAPMVWPPEARRIAVTVEELKTGARGAASAELPRPD